jgi:hypothetical protein
MGILLCLPLASVRAAKAPEEGGGPQTARAHRVIEPPVIDGVVDEEVWQAMEPASNFVQQEPNEGAPATEPTEVRFGYDNNNLYVGIICFDSQPHRTLLHRRQFLGGRLL